MPIQYDQLPATVRRLVDAKSRTAPPRPRRHRVATTPAEWECAACGQRSHTWRAAAAHARTAGHRRVAWVIPPTVAP